MQHIRNYIARDNPLAARGVLAAIRDHVAGLRKAPRKGKTGRVIGTRELVNHKYPHYIVVYHFDSKCVRILRVLRDSQQWTQEG